MSVSANDLVRYACALTGEQPADDPDTLLYAPVWITVTLARLLGVENQIRAAKGEAPLSGPPVIAAVDDTPIPFSEELLLGPALYMLAASLCSVNGDAEGARGFLADYRETLSLAAPAVRGVTKDAYA